MRCLIRDTDIRLKPEEIVRQLYLRRLLENYGYTKNRIAVEFPVKFGSETKRADIVIRDKDHPESAYIIIELKKPKLKDGKDQLKSYCHATGAPIGVWTNGGAISYYHRKDPNYFVELTDIPAQAETLADVLREDFRMADLVKKFNEQTERKSLRQRIEEMEDEVLANAGVDVFEEVFKLIFTKLYDELESTRSETRQLQFRNTGQTETTEREKEQGFNPLAKQQNSDKNLINTLENLGYLPDNFQGGFLFNLLEHKNPKVRLLAAKNIAKLNQMKSLEPLWNAFQKESDTSARREIVSAIGRLRKPQNKPYLFEILQDEDPKVVCQAIRGLLHYEDDILVERKLKPLLNHENETVRTVI